MSDRVRAASGLDACLPRLLGALGWRGNRISLAEIIPPSRMGWTLVELLPRLATLGYREERTRVPRSAQPKLLFPGLLLDKQGHWWCVSEDGEELRVWTETEGESTLGAAAFYQHFRGCRFAGFQEAPPETHTRTGAFWLQDLLSRNRAALGAALALSLVLALFGLLSPQFIGMLYREIDSMSDPGGLVALGLGALLFAMGEVAFLGLRQALLDAMRARFTSILDGELWRRVLSFPLAMSFNVPAAAQYARIHEFEELARQLGRPVARALLDFPFMSILLVALGFMGGAMVLVPLVAMAAFLVMGFFVYPLLKKLEQESASDGLAAQTKLDAVLDHGRPLQQWGIEERWKVNLQKAELAALPSQLNRNQLTATFNFLSHALVSIAGVVAVLVGVDEVLQGRMQGGTLLASMMLVWRILDPFRSVFVLLGSIQTSVQAGRRLQRFMALVGEPLPDPSRPGLRLPPPSVRVEGFYFKYPQATRFALANVTLSLSVNTYLHVGGAAGSGKTSLCLAILGLIDGSNGRVSLGDQNIKQFNPVSYRKAIGYLPLEVPVLPVSVRDNLLLARADATDSDLWATLDEAGLKAEVEGLPEGLDAVLDKSLPPVSADFRRALGVARLLLRDAPLWLLDEPHQGLGPERRLRFRQALEKRRGTITCLQFGEDSEFADLARVFAKMDEGRYLPLKARELPSRKEEP